MPVRARGGARINTAQLEASRVAEHYDEMWKMGDEDMEESGKRFLSYYDGR